MTLAQNGMIIVIGWQTYTIARETMTPAAAAAQLGLIGLLQFVPLFVTTGDKIRVDTRDGSYIERV